jgi:antitoxin ParD1/3/4
MEIALPEPIQAFVEESVQSGRYGSREEVVCAALRLLENREAERQEKLAALEAELLPAVEAVRRGETIPFDEAAVEEILREGRQRLAARAERP